MYKIINSETIVYNKKYYDNVCKINTCEISLYFATKRKFFNLIKTNFLSIYNLQKVHYLKLFIKMYIDDEFSILPISLIKDDYIIYMYDKHNKNKLYIGNEIKDYINMYKVTSKIVR